jgi:hypothetical protein
MYICLDIRVVPSPNEGSGAAIPGATESYDRATEASVPAGPVGRVQIPGSRIASASFYYVRLDFSIGHCRVEFPASPVLGARD